LAKTIKTFFIFALSIGIFRFFNPCPPKKYPKNIQLFKVLSTVSGKKFFFQILATCFLENFNFSLSIGIFRFLTPSQKNFQHLFQLFKVLSTVSSEFFF
jgi:hypothetical protein